MDRIIVTIKADHYKQDYDIDLEKSFLVGDGARDVECAEAAGVKGIRYRGGNLCQTLLECIE